MRTKRLVEPVEPFELLEMKPLYPYLVDEIKRLLAPDRRQLFVSPDSDILNYLGQIVGEEISDHQLRDYPAIEALAFAIIEMFREEQAEISRPVGDHSPWNNDILTRGMRERGPDGHQR